MRLLRESALQPATITATAKRLPNMNASATVTFILAAVVGTLLGVWYIDSKAAAALNNQTP